MSSSVATTASALEAMTDRGKFEMLFRAVLEIREPKYRPLIRTGTNALGETIAAPIDGFARLSDSEPLYGMIEATTTDAERLRTKWLVGSKKDKADLVKAAEFADQIRQHDPEASFIVVLATNQRTSADLLVEAYAFAAQQRIAVDIWENSRIEPVLDATPEGQSIRQRYLGIVADLLSATLMSRLSERSLERYASVLYDDPVTLFVRDVVAQTMTALRGGKSLAFLSGEAGLGKSTVTYHVMREWIATGGFALWASAEQVAQSPTLESLLRELLRDVHPRELIDGAATLLGMLGGLRRLLIVVDDLRHAGDPTEVARRLIAWTRPPENQPAHTVILAPARPQLIAAIASDRERATWTDVIETGRLARAETISFLRSRTTVNAYADEIAALLGDDPFLAGSYVRVAAGQEANTRLAEDVLADLVRAELTAVADERFDEAEIEAAVVHLARVEILDLSAIVI